MSDLFEMLLYEAVNSKTEVPVLLSIDGAAMIYGDVDGSQQCYPFSPPRYTRLLNASLVDIQHPAEDASLRVPRPPVSSAVSLSGGPNRRWLVTLGATIFTGEEVSWDQWLDYNSCTNGGRWEADIVSALKQGYPTGADERAYFHLINVRFHNTQTATNLGGPIYVPTGEIACLGSQR